MTAVYLSGNGVIGNIPFATNRIHLHVQIVGQTKTRFLISHMSIRLATPADASAIGQIRVDAWRAAYQPFMPQEYLEALDPSANLDLLAERLSKPTKEFMVFVAEDEGNTLGFSIIGAPRYPTQELTIELWALNVSPAYWRQGFGKKSGSRYFCRKIFSSFPAGKNRQKLRDRLCLRRPDSSASPRSDPTRGRNLGSRMT
ncbi:GNAT family N-acetyltransferase [Methylomonas sp. MK1]|uniref:GNAT family N-acetyltransferase n=1 Tax=Methylomonas sp. MK1 TaxID=1131552 RepID=UPI000378EE58|nr:GNAT family N-acetyltransferase [Methylomonas sp. MK1]